MRDVDSADPFARHCPSELQAVQAERSTGRPIAKKTVRRHAIYAMHKAYPPLIPSRSGQYGDRF